jgi:hypothetical protein
MTFGRAFPQCFALRTTLSSTKRGILSHEVKCKFVLFENRLFRNTKFRALQHTWIQSIAETRVKGFRHARQDTGPASSRSRGILLARLLLL